jgi:hypothetical protein
MLGLVRSGEVSSGGLDTFSAKFGLVIKERENLEFLMQTQKKLERYIHRYNSVA